MLDDRLEGIGFGWERCLPVEDDSGNRGTPEGPIRLSFVNDVMGGDGRGSR